MNNTEIEVQLSPFGEYPQTREDGTTVSQICDSEAFQLLLENFSGGEIPVDFDHAGEEGGSTRAGAWVERLWVDDQKGLMAVLRLTPAGEEAVVGREYRFLSPAWELRADGRPERLLSVAFTNKPNLPLAPVLNSRRSADQNKTIINNAPNQEQSIRKPEMEKILTALGLAPDATEEDVVGAIDALKDKIAEMEAERAEAEADAFADEIGENACGEEREAIKNAYKLCPAAAKAIASNMKKRIPSGKTAVVNSLRATPPRSMADRIAGKRAEDVISEIRRGL